MPNVEAALAEWRSLYAALGAAELRLRNAREGRCHCGIQAAELEREVLGLQARSERALTVVDAALAASKAVHAHEPV